MENQPTFAQLDALRAEREAKKRELVDRLAKVLVSEFSFEEIRFIRGAEFDSIRIEAFERARNETEARR